MELRGVLFGFRVFTIAVTGWGQADKKQVQAMVKTLLRLNEIPKPDDAADALAVAICCAHSLNILRILKK